MKTFLVFFSFLFIIAQQFTVSAHSFGQPPNFKINGQYAILYPVYSSSTPNLSIPQDNAPANYLVNQKINFEIDVNVLGVPMDIVNKTDFTWDLGDGQKGSGLKNDHVYSKMGTYLLTIYADDKSSPKQVFETISVNILPDNNYKLPQAKIKANGKESKDPLTDILRLDFSKEIEFKAEDAESTGKIVSYYWDFGDIKSSNEKIAKHIYASDLTQVFPLLEVKDENGFISDNYIQLENEKLGQNQFTQTQKKNSSRTIKTAPSQLKYTLITFGVLLLITFLIYKAKKKKDR